MGYYNSGSRQRLYDHVRHTVPSPCKNCTDRIVGCHSNCSKHDEYKEEVDKKLKEFIKSYDHINAGEREDYKRSYRVSIHNKSRTNSGAYKLTKYERDVKEGRR